MAANEIVGPGVEKVVAQELEGSPVKGVGAGFGRYVDLSRFTAALRGIYAGLHLGLLYGINRGQQNIQVEVAIGVRYAVQRVIAPGGARSRQRHGERGARTA